MHGFFSADPSANRLRTSDSDFSDTEAGKFAAGKQVQVVHARVRKAALNLFYHVIKVTMNSILNASKFIVLF